MMGEEMLSRTTIPATFVSFKRGQRKVHPRYALLKIDNVIDRSEAGSYVGNGVVYYKTTPEGEKYPVHGVITRLHGNSGAVRARFARNLNPKALGTHAFVKLYKVEADEI